MGIKYSQYKYSIFWIAAFLIIFISYLIFGYMDIVGKGAAILCIGSVLHLIFRSYKSDNIVFLVFFVFMAMYAWPAKPFFFDGKLFATYNTNANYITAFWVTIVLALFFVVINKYLKTSFSTSTISPSFYKKNDRLFWGLYILTLLCIVLFRPRGNIYAGDDETYGSSMYEYVLIFFYGLIIYSNQEKHKKKWIYVLALLYVLFTFASGGRVSAIMLGLLFLILNFQDKINMKFAAVGLIFAVWLLNVVGNIRANPAALLQGDFVSYLNPFIVDDLSEFQHGNEADIYWASERLFLLAEDGELDVFDRLKSLLMFILSPVIPGSLLPPIYNLSQYKTELYGTGGGCLAPIIFYMFGGLIGVYLLARFIAKRLNSLKCLNDSFGSFYAVLMIVIEPRWFGYFPIGLIKFCVWGALFLCILKKIDRKLKNDKRNACTSYNHAHGGRR